MLSAFSNSFKIPELRQRIFFTFALIFVSRIVATIPLPMVDAVALQAAIDQMRTTTGGGFLDLYNLFSGGALERCAIGALGIMPYISASIILQLLTAVLPQLERLAREGDVGREKISQYTRYLTLVLCVVQGYFFALSLENPRMLLGIDVPLVTQPGIPFRLLAILSMTTATLLLMWLGEQITEGGIGNGISIIITVSILGSLPSALTATITMFRPIDGIAQFTVFHLVGLVLMFFLVVAGTIAVTQAQRKIPVQYAKRVVGRKVYGGQSTYMPLRVNYSGVMPIIFAQAILMFPPRVLGMMPFEFAKTLGANLDYGTGWYNGIYAVMIFFFSYFWVATQFNPIQIADDLKKYGGYVPGIRPGRPTAEFLDRTMTRITFSGAVFLTVIAVIPMLMWQRFNIPFIVASFFGGTSLLIIVGVLLDSMRQIESHLLMRNYDGFLKKGKLTSRR